MQKEALAAIKSDMKSLLEGASNIYSAASDT